MPEETPTEHNVVGSAVAGLSSTLFGHPFDTVKAHLQTNSRLRSSTQVVREIHAAGLFRGMGPPLFNAIVMNTVMFSVFDKVQAKCENPFAAGLVSGFATAMISTPTDYLKIQAQLHGTSTREALSMVRQKMITHHRPVYQMMFPLYRGHLANLAREGVFTMTYLGLYHKMAYLERGEESPTDNNSSSLLSVALRSSTTGAMAWVISYPIDTIKTIVQSGGVGVGGGREAKTRSYYSVWESIPSMSQLYKGCGTSTFRAILVTSSRMIAYEWVVGSLMRYHQ